MATNYWQLYFNKQAVYCSQVFLVAGLGYACMEWNSHCTHLTHVGSIVQSRLSYLYCHRVLLCETTSAAARTLLYLLYWAFSICVLFALLHTLSHSVTFESLFPFLLRCLLREYDGAIPTTPNNSLGEHNGSTNYLLDLCWENGWDWHERVDKFFTTQLMLLLFNKYECIYSMRYIHTYRHHCHSTC